jgi:hypothetical protein
VRVVPDAAAHATRERGIRKEADMSTVPHQEPRSLPERRRPAIPLDMVNMWSSIAISVMWLVVLFDALWGPNFVSTSASTSTTIPSAVFVAFFAWLGTLAVARHGLDRHDRDKG